MLTPLTVTPPAVVTTTVIVTTPSMCTCQLNPHNEPRVHTVYGDFPVVVNGHMGLLGCRGDQPQSYQDIHQGPTIRPQATGFDIIMTGVDRNLVALPRSWRWESTLCDGKGTCKRSQGVKFTSC